ncbi:MAG: DUF2752 domain-containing protein [Bacteroidaceae bacterium]|nr:DUF2752 domain-containing protein [Bacteroidaceae bacterium]
MAGLLLRLFTSINILPPCLWTTIFHVHCPGCGMTRACLCLLQLDFVGAWKTNPLIFPAVAIIIAAVVADFRKFSLHLHNESSNKPQ